jgi:2-polyprenyl-3-methyl-5-hydroxy-6-metoxy-1,4-benzoquinol methylase
MPRNLSEVYSGVEYLQQAKAAYLTNVDYRIQRFATERVNLIRRFLTVPDRVALLDIGCGTGWFLGYAKCVGFSVSGYEFSPDLVSFTSQQIGCEVYSGDISEVPGQFDVITLFDVVEHVPNPAELVTMLGDRLNEGGIILIYTPNFDSVGISVMRDRSNLVVPSRHLTYFNRQSISVLANLAKMRVDWFETAGIDIGDIKSLFEPMEERPADNELWQQLSDAVQPVIDKAGLGNHLRAILRRKADRQDGGRV